MYRQHVAGNNVFAIVTANGSLRISVIYCMATDNLMYSASVMRRNVSSYHVVKAFFFGVCNCIKRIVASGCGYCDIYAYVAWPSMRGCYDLH